MIRVDKIFPQATVLEQDRDTVNESISIEKYLFSRLVSFKLLGWMEPVSRTDISQYLCFRLPDHYIVQVLLPEKIFFLHGPSILINQATDYSYDFTLQI